MENEKLKTYPIVCPNRIGQKANFIRWLGELVGTNDWTNHGKEFEASEKKLKKKMYLH